MSKLPNKKRIAPKAGRKLNPHASQSQGGATRGKLPVQDQKQESEDIRRAVDDGMQDLRIKKPS
jgi:hypothetical protein